MSFKWKLAQRLEIRWWQRYLKKKEVDDYLNRKQQYWDRILALCPFQLRPSDRILDAGCGPAGIFINLQKYRVDAIDPLIDQYDKKIPHFSFSRYPAIHFQKASLEQFVPTTSYEVVFCLNAINHVDDIEQAVEQLSKATKTEGWLVFSIDAHKWKLLKWVFRLIPADFLHPHQYDLKEYEQMLVDRHFEIINKRKLKKGGIFDYHLIFAKKMRQ